MPVWRLREFRDDDLDQAIQIWEQSRVPTADEPVFALAEVTAAARAKQSAVVAEVGDEMVGMAVAQIHGERAWVLLVALASRWRGRGIGSALLAELERRLRSSGVRRICTLVPEGATGSVAFENSGYSRRAGLVYYELLEPLAPAQSTLLTELGGRLLPRGLWQSMAGMDREKEIIERRVVLPLSNPDVAERYRVLPPKSVILFGPPGTGKTSFAKAVASRLGWPFVELFPSRLAAATTGGLAASLREVFADLTELDELLLFIDEVEEIAGTRSGTATSPAHGVTNELLKLIPTFRENYTRLLICATNSVRSLDPAFLRPGRFDYVIPIGPPDEPARNAIWQRYLGSATETIDVDRLTCATAQFTPADIEYAARAGAQSAFERAMRDDTREPATTEDYLTAVANTRPTLTPEILTAFEQDQQDYTRL
ncbi:GNAT family N-acetyltransferase [Nocardia abscessus]|uniref:ATP-binding protein n=1 Tax=Nocardia abscessus TaxID=120957 RepID=UPI0018945E12|nr:GNAT family N-acetyltransferase [Nocardia abscessus]MBF6337023.1 GNAT family N-acetyltransferase [Nocardia abscessus]